MTETTKIDLSGWMHLFRFMTAEWWDHNSKFAVVRGSTEKDPEAFALRLDLEKRAFLDHVTNPKTDRLLQNEVQQISQLVWNAKRQQAQEQQQQANGKGHAAA